MSIPFASLLCALGLGGCGLVDSLTPDPPPIPGDYPQLDNEGARIDVVIDGMSLDATGYCSYDDSGIDDSKLRLELDVDHLRFLVRDREVGEYSSRADEVEAFWTESGSFGFGPECGESIVNLDGEKRYEGILGSEVASWGTVQLVLCSDAGETIEVSGKFSCAPY